MHKRQYAGFVVILFLGLSLLSCPTPSQPSDDDGDDEDTITLQGGLLTSDLTLTDQDYRVLNTILVPAGITLTIEPGATLSFEQNMGIYVEGVLTAIGTAVKPILLTGKQKIRGYWYGVELRNTNSFDNALDWVTIEYAGSSAGAPLYFGANLMLSSPGSGYPVRMSVTNCTLQDSAGYGFFFHYDAVVDAFSNNQITDNADGAGFVFGRQVGYLDDSSSYTGNDVDAVIVPATNIIEDCTWPGIDVCYVVTGNQDVYAHLTIAPGANLLFEQDLALNIAGSTAALIAEGTPTSWIVFSAVQPIKGFWFGINFYNANSVDNKLRYALVEYGGADGWLGTVALTSNGYPVQADVRDCAIEHGNHYGIWVDPTHGSINADVLTENTFSDNTDGAVFE